MGTNLRIHFQGLPRTYSARRWDLLPVPEHPDGFEFEPMPANIKKIVVPPRSVFQNRQGDRRAGELMLQDVKCWGDDDWDPNPIYANAQSSDGTRFCLRLIVNAENVVRDPSSRPYRALSRLLDDAMFHSAELKDSEVAGSLVPIHYGVWAMKTGDWGGKVLFSITQGCGVSWNELSHTKMGTNANRMLVARTCEALHDYGYEHGGMADSYALRHVLIDIHAPGLAPADRLNGKAPCYIVGFSDARAGHRCNRTVPIVPLEVRLPDETVGCQEIADLLRVFKFVRSTESANPALEVVQWHEEYSREHPDLENFKVMIAQRAKLYPQFAPVHPTYLVAFADEGMYARVEVTIPGSEEVSETDALIHDLRRSDLNDPVSV
ncbi:hypothetical protein B0H15DRAFT_860205 [Mycena belliarum]|uniref:Uncharacterized protein n=1 Tax=Mycena belliarum TaxID=1033014 RepID=A0AAD6TTD0_9AGAR|nr:hypothetical protein B0H15DRAFT_860205 [Mycena belliae]